MDIPCPVTVGSYLLTIREHLVQACLLCYPCLLTKLIIIIIIIINTVWLISTVSFKFLFLRCADSLNFHLYVTSVQ